MWPAIWGSFQIHILAAGMSTDYSPFESPSLAWMLKGG